MDAKLLEKAQRTRSVGLVLGKPEKAVTQAADKALDAKDGDPLQFRTLGVIFSRGERSDLRDLDGDKFMPDVSQIRSEDVDDEVLRSISTDYGIEEQYLVPGKTRVPVLWDHGRGVLGKARIGWATFEKLTDEGLEFLIEIERDNVRRYDQFVEYWWDNKSLGVSSQTMSSVFDYDWEHGLIRSWWPIELSLTNGPALPTTRENTSRVDQPPMAPAELARSLGITPIVEVRVKDKDKNTEVPVEETDTPVQRSASEELGDAVTELADNLDKSNEATALDAIVALLKNIHSNLSALDQRLTDIEATGAKAADVEALAGKLRETRDDLVSGLKTSFTGLGTILSNRVKSLAVETVIEASDVELDATKTAHGQNHVPQSSPRGAGFTRTGRPVNMGE